MPAPAYRHLAVPAAAVNPAMLAARDAHRAPAAVSLHDLLRYSAAVFTSHTRMPVTIAFEDSSATLSPVEASHLALVMTEAFSNIARHAHALRVSLSTRHVGGRLYVRLHDNGLGCEPVKLAAGPGLARMRQHAIAAGARVWLETAPFEGTTVVFELPASPA